MGSCHKLVLRKGLCLMSCKPHVSPGAKGLKWRFFDHESEQAEFGLKL